MGGNGMKRATAGVIGFAALAAIVVQFALNGARPGLEPWGARVWDLMRYFTILTNGLVAGVLLRQAAGRAAGPVWQGTAALNIAMVGAVYQALLRPAVPATGAAWWTDLVFHAAVPLAMPVWWLLWGDRPAGWSGVLAWLPWPIAYCACALVRGGLEGDYPYFFLDVGRFGAARIALNIAGLAAVFALAGLALLAAARGLDAARRGAALSR